MSAWIQAWRGSLRAGLIADAGDISMACHENMPVLHSLESYSEAADRQRWHFTSRNNAAGLALSMPRKKLVADSYSAIS